MRAILDDARAAPLSRAVADLEPNEPIPTFADAVDAWLTYPRVDKRRKRSTLDDAQYVADGHLLPRFGRDTALYRLERHEVVFADGGRQRVEVREQRADTFTTRDVDEFRRDLLAGPISPRSAQKVLVLLHAVFKLAKTGPPRVELSRAASERRTWRASDRTERAAPGGCRTEPPGRSADGQPQLRERAP